jgi:hypothetical protein
LVGNRVVQVDKAVIAMKMADFLQAHHAPPVWPVPKPSITLPGAISLIVAIECTVTGARSGWRLGGGESHAEFHRWAPAAPPGHSGRSVLPQYRRIGDALAIWPSPPGCIMLAGTARLT